MPNIKICHRVEEIPFLCPLCKGSIHRVIKEDNAIIIDSKGEPKNVENLLFEDFFECSVCHEPLNGLIEHDGNEYTLLTKRCKQILTDNMINKIKEDLSINPFGKL